MGLLACLVKKCRGNAAGASCSHAAEAPRSPLAKSTKQEEADNQKAQASETQAASAEATPVVLKDSLPPVTDNAGSKFKPTMGAIKKDAKNCIASYPARFGDFRPPVVDGNVYDDAMHAVNMWEKIISLKAYSHACVWTGKDNSKMSEWFEPWKENIKLAVKSGQKLMFCVIPESATSNYGALDGQCNQMGGGQTLERNWLDEERIDYEVEVLDFNKILHWSLMDKMGNLPAKSCMDC